MAMTELRFPRPARRGRKPRRPIPRVHAGGKRSRVPEPLLRHRKLEELADALWSLIVRSTSPLCVRCRRRPVTDPHHLVSRRYRALRWELDNGAPLCRACHCDVGEDGHENRLLAHDLVGPERWDAWQQYKRIGRADPSLAVVALRYEVEKRGLTAQARERGLL
jgi:hypothetical protein